MHAGDRKESGRALVCEPVSITHCNTDPEPAKPASPGSCAGLCSDQGDYNNQGHLAPDETHAKTSSSIPSHANRAGPKETLCNCHFPWPLFTDCTHCVDLQHPNLMVTFQTAEGITHTISESLKSSWQMTASTLCLLMSTNNSTGHVKIPAPDQYEGEVEHRT